MLDRFSADAYFPKTQHPLPPKKRSTKKPLAMKFLAQKTPPEELQAMARYNGLLRKNNSDRVSDDKCRYGKDRCLSDSTKMQPSSKMARRTTAREASIDIVNENLASSNEAVEFDEAEYSDGTEGYDGAKESNEANKAVDSDNSGDTDYVVAWKLAESFEHGVERINLMTIGNERLTDAEHFRFVIMIGLEYTCLVHRWYPQFFCKAMSKFLKTMESTLARQQFLEEYFAGVHARKVNTLYPDPTFCLVLC
jgi:hypothetical protein